MTPCEPDTPRGSGALFNDCVATTQTPLRVAALTGGKNVPSARFRVRALTADLALRGITLNEYIPSVGKYPPTGLWRRGLWLPAALTARLPGIAASRSHDVTLLQRELISTLYTLEGLTGAPRVLDVDDAIFLHRAGKPTKRLAKSAALVLAGNPFLADWFSQWHSNVQLLPTSIDTRRFQPSTKLAPDSETVTIGWTGSKTNLHYLQLIEPALKKVLNARPKTRLHVVCDKAPELATIPPAQLSWSAWHPDSEVTEVQGFDIGIMPLLDGDWERGKCAFKALQYMACSKPVVASPVGVNAQLLAGENIGFAPTDNASWESALIALIDDADLRNRLGQAGRALAQARYDTAVIAQRMATALRSVI